MTQNEIRAFFPGLYPLFGGVQYAVPTLAWLRGPFWNFFRGRLWDENLQAWRVGWECRDFARAYACAAQECNALASAAPGDALVVGEFWFRPHGNPVGSDHAICPAITDQGLVFIEPQTGDIRPVTPTEILTCAFLRF